MTRNEFDIIVHLAEFFHEDYLASFGVCIGQLAVEAYFILLAEGLVPDITDNSRKRRFI
jgi:hypothetical protein